MQIKIREDHYNPKDKDSLQGYGIELRCEKNFYENISDNKTPSDIEYLKAALETKLKSSLSSQYKKNLVFVFNLISKKCKNEISNEDIKSIILSFDKGTTQKMVKNHNL